MEKDPFPIQIWKSKAGYANDEAAVNSPIHPLRDARNSKRAMQSLQMHRKHFQSLAHNCKGPCVVWAQDSTPVCEFLKVSQRQHPYDALCQRRSWTGRSRVLLFPACGDFLPRPQVFIRIWYRPHIPLWRENKLGKCIEKAHLCVNFRGGGYLPPISLSMFIYKCHYRPKPIVISRWY